ALVPPISSWGKWTASFFRPAETKQHAIAASARSEVHRTAWALSREALRADPHDDVRAGSVRLLERRDARGDRQARGRQPHRSHRNTGILFDAAAQAGRALSHPGVHQHLLHAARR